LNQNSEGDILPVCIKQPLSSTIKSDDGKTMIK